MLVNFTYWLKNLHEGVFGNWSYHVPQDKEQQMYDFYMMEYLLPSGVHFHMRPATFGPDDPDSAADAEDKEKGFSPMSDFGGKKVAGDMSRTIDDKLNYALYEVADKLLPALKKEMQSAIYFAVGAELRHFDSDALQSVASAYTGGDTKRATDKINKTLGNMESKLGPQYADLLRKYIRNYLEADYLKSQSTHVKDFLKNVGGRTSLDRLHKGSSSDYRKSVKAMRKAGGTDEDWMVIGKWLFKHAEWERLFGGSNWAQIADAWLHLEHAKATTHLIAYIDHVYDLQHNTGSLFTKLKKYAKPSPTGDGNYAWIQKALDNKRDLVSPHEMIEHLSAPMRELALVGLKVKTGKTWADFEEEWPEIVKEKTNVYNHQKMKEHQKEKEKDTKTWNNFKDKSLAAWEQQRFDAAKAWENGQSPSMSVPDLIAGKEKFIASWEKSHPKPTFKSTADYERDWDYSHSKPTPITVDAFETTLKDSGSPYSLGKLTKKYKEGKQRDKEYLIQAHGGSSDIPPYEDMQIGDQIAFEYPSKDWFTIINKKPSDKSVHPTYGPAPDLLVYKKPYSDETFTTDWKVIKGYKSSQKMKFPNKPAATAFPNKPAAPGQAKSKYDFDFSSPPTPMKPAPAAPAVYKDSVGKEIKVGDKIKKVSSKFADKIGTVAALEGGMVEVQWDTHGYYGSYPPNELTVIALPTPTMPVKSLPPKPVDAPPTEPDYSGFHGPSPWHGVGASMPPATLKAEPKKAIPIAPQVEPAKVEPPKKEYSEVKNVKETWDSLTASLPKKLRIARLVIKLKNLNSHAGYDDIFAAINQTLTLGLTPEDIKVIREIIAEEKKVESYYQSRGSYKFPEKLTPTQASNRADALFSEAPHVFIDSDTMDKINQALLKHDHIHAVKYIRDTTAFTLLAAKGLCILFKLHLYLDSSVKFS